MKKQLILQKLISITKESFEEQQLQSREQSIFNQSETARRYKTDFLFFNFSKKSLFFFLLFLSFFSGKVFSQSGVLTGWGMSNCAQYSFSICPNQVITPLAYGNQNYACDGTSMDDVSFVVSGPNWKVAKHNWNFVSNVTGKISGTDASGVAQTITFGVGDIIKPRSYSGTNPIFVQFEKNGSSVGVPLNQNNFAISIDPVLFTGNSYTYCPNTENNISVSINQPSQGGPWTYNWVPGNFTGNPVVVNPVENTTYIVTATSAAGCTSTVSVVVTVSCTPTGCCIGNPCPSIITNPLVSNWQVPINNFNYIFSKNASNTGRVGIGVVGCTPGNLLEVNKGGTSSTSGLRLTDLTTATTLPANNKALSIDANGDVILVAIAPSITNACGTINYVPKTTTGGNLGCSQIFDNGTSVGLGTTTGFGYTWSGGLTGATAPPSSGNVKLYINGVSKALAYFATSDMKFKKDIKVISNATDILKKIEGKTYLWKTEEYKDKGFTTVKQYGFIAQELEKVIPEAVATDENGDKSVNYDMIIPVLVQGSKEQASVIENLQKQIDELKKMIQHLTVSNSINQSVSNNSQEVDLTDKNIVVLNQNIPNPFAESTLVTYNIPSDFAKAQIIFNTIEGKIIKVVEIKEKGKGTIHVFANDLSNGIYSYTLIVDGKSIDTKKMVKQ